MSIAVISILTLAYILVTIFLRKTSSFEDFSVGNRNTSKWLIFFSLSATIIGPGFSLAFVNEGFESAFLYPLLGLFYGLQMLIVGFFIAPRIRAKCPDATSIGDVVLGSLSHESKLLRALVGLVSVLVGIGVIGVLTKAGGSVFQSLLGIDSIYGALITTVIVALYSYYGGIKATMFTDAIQFSLFIVLIPSLLIFILSNNNIGFSTFSSISLMTTLTAIEEHSLIAIFGLVAWMIFGDILQPPILNRILSSKDRQTAKWSFILSAFFVMTWLFVMSSIGVLANIGAVDFTSGDGLLIEIGKAYYPSFLYAMFAVAMIGIIMSSLDSLLNSTSTVMVRDILSSAKEFDNSKKLILSKVVTIVVAILGLLISLVVPNILSGLLFIASIWAPTMLVAILTSIFLENTYWQSAVTSIVAGFTSSLLWSILDMNNYFPAIIVGLVISLLSYILTHKSLIKS